MDELEQFDSMNWLQTTHQPKALRSPDITKQLQEKRKRENENFVLPFDSCILKVGKDLYNLKAQSEVICADKEGSLESRNSNTAEMPTT